MSDPAPAPFSTASVASPCIRVCVLVRAPSGRLCRGCGRTPAEIGSWLGYSPAQREAVMAQLAARKAAMPRDLDSNA